MQIIKKKTIKQIYFIIITKTIYKFSYFEHTLYLLFFNYSHKNKNIFIRSKLELNTRRCNYHPGKLFSNLQTKIYPSQYYNNKPPSTSLFLFPSLYFHGIFPGIPCFLLPPSLPWSNERASAEIRRTRISRREI